MLAQFVLVAFVAQRTFVRGQRAGASQSPARGGALADVHRGRQGVPSGAAATGANVKQAAGVGEGEYSGGARAPPANSKWSVEGGPRGANAPSGERSEEREETTQEKEPTGGAAEGLNEPRRSKAATGGSDQPTQEATQGKEREGDTAEGLNGPRRSAAATGGSNEPTREGGGQGERDEVDTAEGLNGPLRSAAATGGSDEPTREAGGQGEHSGTQEDTRDHGGKAGSLGRDAQGGANKEAEVGLDAQAGLVPLITFLTGVVVSVLAGIAAWRLLRQGQSERACALEKEVRALEAEKGWKEKVESEERRRGAQELEDTRKSMLEMAGAMGGERGRREETQEKVQRLEEEIALLREQEAASGNSKAGAGADKATQTEAADHRGTHPQRAHSKNADPAETQATIRGMVESQVAALVSSQKRSARGAGNAEESSGVPATVPPRGGTSVSLRRSARW